MNNNNYLNYKNSTSSQMAYKNSMSSQMNTECLLLYKSKYYKYKNKYLL